MNQTTTRPEPDHPPRSAPRATLSDDDRDILAGISAFVYAVANRDDPVDQPQVLEEEEQPYCGTVAPDASGSCVREVGHSGRHKYRPLNGLVN